jgi:hypothetical protein
MEDKQKRLARLTNGSPVEIIETLLNSMHNFFMREIGVASDNNLHYLVMLGDHAVALTISEGLFGKAGLDGYKLFLEKFVDQDSEGFNFLEIAENIHNWRNVIAHQWLSSSGYDLGIDLDMKLGWENRKGVIYFNPKLYHEAFNGAFKGGGKIWQYERILTEEQMQKAKERLLKKYIGR